MKKILTVFFVSDTITYKAYEKDRENM